MSRNQLQGTVSSKSRSLYPLKFLIPSSQHAVYNVSAITQHAVRYLLAYLCHMNVTKPPLTTVSRTSRSLHPPKFLITSTQQAVSNVSAITQHAVRYLSFYLCHMNIPEARANSQNPESSFQNSNKECFQHAVYNVSAITQHAVRYLSAYLCHMNVPEPALWGM